MLENYEKELSQKRRERRIFWVIVWLFSTFLYLFFQGYYPYIRLDLAGYFNKTGTGTQSGSEGPQIVRAFGIINIRSLPAADSITVNGVNFVNGDKVIYDYGNYNISIEKNGFIGLKTKVTLDKKNPFLIEALELLKKPVAAKYAFDIKNIIPFTGTKIIAEVSSTGTVVHTGGIRTYKVFDPDTIETARSFSSALSPIGRGYFASESGSLFALDESTYKMAALKNKAGTGTLSCIGVTLVGEEIYCPKNKTFLTGNSDFAAKIVSVKESIIATSEGLFTNKMERLLKASSENSGSLAKIDDIVTIGGKDYLLSSGELFESLPDIADSESKELRFDTLPMSTVGKSLRFGGDTILLGYMKDGSSGFLLIDERGNKYPIALKGEQVSSMKIEPIGTGYLISTKTRVYFYQKGAENPELLAEGDILLASSKRIFFRKDSTTYEMPLIVGKE